MHELGICQEVVRIASERCGGASVKRVVLEVGVLTAVLPEALRFCFQLATEETPLQGAALEIVEVPGQARCRGCGASLVLRVPYGQCACGGIDLEWTAGDALHVRELEVA